MNRAKRYAAIVMLRQTNTLLVHVHQAMTRSVNVDAADGLSEKEKAYIRRRIEVLERAQEDMTKLTSMMFNNYNGTKVSKRKDF